MRVGFLHASRSRSRRPQWGSYLGRDCPIPGGRGCDGAGAAHCSWACCPWDICTRTATAASASRCGAPQVSVVVSFEPLSEGGSEDLRVSHVGGHAAEPRVLRVGFVNDGPRRVRSALVNVLVDARVEITASDHLGDTTSHTVEQCPSRHRRSPYAFLGRQGRNVAFGATLLNYRSRSRCARARQRVPSPCAYDADDLHGGERVDEQQVYVIDLKDRQ